ncbi:MAG: PAS domain S-box protein [Magnetococcales bacterium]|nr:PAS domain S-box protein [Magnetococcales bacterium]
MVASPEHLRLRQLTRLIWPRFLIIFGLLYFVVRASVTDLERYAYAGLSLPLFVALLFLLTLGHLWWLKNGRNLELLTRIQCALDPLLVVILVILTGSFNSPFLFLNNLVTLNAALLLGRREALLTAGMILIFSAGALSLTTLLLKMPVEPAPVLLRGLLLHGSANFLTALLGGALAYRVASLQQAFDRQTDSLADLAALHEQIVSALPYGLISVNNQGIIRAVNPGLRELMGSGAPTMLGHPLRALLPEFQWAVDQAGGEEVYVEIPRDDLIWGLNVSFLYNRHQERIGALLVIRDLSPMKRLERELADREKMALTGRMAAGMAHEIRNPLASILSAAQMFSPRDQKERRFVTIIREEVTRLKQLTGDFLLFSRPARPERQVVALARFLAEMAEQIQVDPRWETRRLLLDLPAGVGGVRCDPGHLRQIFWNLLLNAMQATGRGGKVLVAARATRNRVEVMVGDDGPGVDPELLPRVIEPFFSTRAGGSGLGLAVVHHLVLSNGGRLGFRNGPRGGLQVELDFEAGDGGNSGL